MNITCSQCHGQFSITAEQLGTRGKCPHCRANIVLPKAKGADRYQLQPLQIPSTRVQTMLCGLVAFAIHVVLLIILIVSPWKQFNNESSDDGYQVTIGHVPRTVLIDRLDEDFEPIEVANPSEDESSDQFDSEVFSRVVSDFATSPELDVHLSSPSVGGRSPLDFKPIYRPIVPVGVAEDFGSLLNRLQRDGLDIVITFDSTGSMQGEINQVKEKIEWIGTVLFKLVPKTRLSICTYRDTRDEYVVRGLPLTDNLAKIVLYLQDIDARGGGDQPEAVDAGLRWSIEKNQFRRRARKVILLFGDAPPHASKQVQCEKLVSEFRNQGGVVNTVTCRSERPMSEFESIAQIGRGESFLTRNEREIMSQLIVLVFGSQHREKVLEAFDILGPSK